MQDILALIGGGALGIFAVYMIAAFFVGEDDGKEPKPAFSKIARADAWLKS